MDFRFFDAHTHTQFAAFDKDREAVVERALECGVGMINVGTKFDTSEAAVKLAYKYKEGIYAAVGLHPIHASGTDYWDKKESGAPPAREGENFDYEAYKKLAMNEKVVAIGECGLDYYRIENNELGIMNKQKDVFLKQIELAHEIKKPLMIHCRSGMPERTSPQNEAGRNAFDDLIEILNSYFILHNSGNPGVIHFFSGIKDDARKLLDLGFSFTFGGVVTFTRDYDEVIKYIPKDKILSETDAPYVAPAPYRGKRNEPVYVVEVVKKLAEIKGLKFEKMSEQILENTKRVFHNFML